MKEKTLQNTDIDLLLRKTVEYKIKGFKDYYELLKKYFKPNLAMEPISISLIQGKRRVT